MEKYSASCRLFLIAEKPSRVMDALQSRCLPVRVPAPTLGEIENLLHDVAKKEKLELRRNSPRASPRRADAA